MRFKSSLSKFTVCLGMALFFCAGSSWAGPLYPGGNHVGEDHSNENHCCSDISGANLKGANFSNTDLSGSDLSDTNLKEANLSGADLCGANLSGAELKDADLTGATYDETTIWPDGFDPEAAGASQESGGTGPAGSQVPAASDAGRLALLVLLLAGAAFGLRDRSRSQFSAKRS